MDDADRAQKMLEIEQERLSRLKRQKMEDGKAGECDLCGRWFSRLVDGACGGCRDKYRLR